MKNWEKIMAIYIWIVVQQMYVCLTYPFNIAQHTLSHIVEDCKLDGLATPDNIVWFTVTSCWTNNVHQFDSSLSLFNFCFTVFVQRVLNFLLELLSVLPYLTWAFLNRQSWGGGVGGYDARHHKFVVIALIIKFGRGIKLDVFYTMVSKKFVTSLLLCNYDIITCILADGRSQNFRCS